MKIINADKLKKMLEDAIEICRKNNMSGERIDELGSVLDYVNENAVDLRDTYGALKMNLKKAEEENMDLKLQVAELRGTVKGLKFSVRCNGVCGNEVA